MTEQSPPPGNPVPIDSTPGTAEPLAAEPADVMPQAAEGQWALVWREFRKRKLAVLCAVMVVLLATVSIFAPFIANDRPLYYVGINRFQYQEAARTTRVVLAAIIRRKGLPAPVEPDRKAGFFARMKRSVFGDPAPPDPVKIVGLQLDIMAHELAGEQRERFGTLQEQIVSTARQVTELAERQAEAAVARKAGTGEAGEAEVPAVTVADLLAQLGEQRAALRREFDARKVTLAVSGHWPVLVSLNWLDVVFMAGNLLLLTLPLWRLGVRRCIPPGRPGVRSTVTAGVMFGVPVLVAGLWWLCVPERLDRSPYKQGVLAAEADAGKAPVVYEGVAWPLVPYGLDEDSLTATYARPPWWPAEADGSEQAAAVARKQQKATAALGPWDAPHWMGTDDIGRDLLCRMIWGGRVSLSVGIVAVSIYVTLGIIIGAIAGYFRGLPDLLISRVIEVVICFPSFFLILTIVSFVGPSIYNIMIVIGLTGWTGVARLVRGEFLRLGSREFVLAGRALGYSSARIIFRHVLPNALAPVLVSATFGVAGAILTESGLSFLGFGITVPKPSWGGILAAGRSALNTAPWLIYFPGLAIFLTVTSYNLVGEALRDAADPRLRGQRA